MEEYLLTRTLKNEIKLVPMTEALYDNLMKKYVADPLMCDAAFEYEKDVVAKVFQRKSNDKKRVWFAICQNLKVIGDVYLKNIDMEKKTAVLSIALANDQFKGKGYGTLVEKNILDYGFNELGLTVIYADTIFRNVRSQHVLEKIGFRYICEDKDFKYYKCSNVTVM